MAVLPVISAVAGIAGAGLSAAGAYGSAEAQANAASYQSQVAKNNAAIADQNAAWQYESGDIQADNLARNARNVVGTTKAGQAASGVDVNSGSAVDVRAAEAELGSLDAQTARTNSARQAYGYQVQSYSDTAQSQLYQNEAKSASGIAPISALGSFLGGASSVGSNFARYSGLNFGQASPAVATFNPATSAGAIY